MKQLENVVQRDGEIPIKFIKSFKDLIMQVDVDDDADNNNSNVSIIYCDKGYKEIL